MLCSPALQERGKSRLGCHPRCAPAVGLCLHAFDLIVASRFTLGGSVDVQASLLAGAGVGVSSPILTIFQTRQPPENDMGNRHSSPQIGNRCVLRSCLVFWPGDIVDEICAIQASRIALLLFSF